MSHRRVLRWDVRIDDEPNEIGGGKVLQVECRPSAFSGLPARVEVWTEEEVPDDWPHSDAVRPTRLVQVFGTGHPLPAAAFRHLGSCLDQERIGLVWHLYEMARPVDNPVE